MAVCIASLAQTSEKSRAIITTDLGGTDPDDKQSMVHLLVSSNLIDIEGLISSQVWSTDPDKTGAILEVLNGYEQVYPSLIKHESGFPTPDYLRSVTMRGQSEATMTGVGKGLESAGSKHIIEVVDRPDTRPVWILAWGGMNTLAQAIYDVKHSRSDKDFRKFLSKIRVYDILGQDDAGAWIAKLYPEVFYIRNKAVYGWQPSDEWIKNNIQRHQPFGSHYPNREWVYEGDSPSFLFLLLNGINDPDHINYGGWGGRFDTEKQKNIPSMDWVKRCGRDESIYDDYYMYGSSDEGSEAIRKWHTALWNDFAARMSWTATDDYKATNHPPHTIINGDGGKMPLTINAVAGKKIKLDASASTDPDGDRLAHRWYVYSEPSTCGSNVKIDNPSSPKCVVHLPQNASGKEIHIIHELTDKGSPNLISNRRIVIKIK